MKKLIYISSRVVIMCALFVSSGKLYSQKDTLHIYYQGLQTSVLDSNDAKITKWAKSLKGRHVDVEIYAYYDNADFKKSMIERAENLQLVVIRKARDFVTVTSSGPVKGKKWQRIMADIVYTADPNAPKPQENNEAKTSNSASSESKTNNTEGEKNSENNKPADKKSHENKVVQGDKNSEYVIDSIYVNGVLKVTKRKVKKN